ncbi:nucleotide-binding universal stress UspA family protein [Nocardiopsis mwathae]|uniref:Nucleotide-binding universal stress UspA family protein n=1 Tax=Nocardiopsis mwathae TaxID=1472723 RepID=A0A7W9YH10_9ACTN|nr:universal stress protein [Nocardiopsis mwathae]MBB6171929.1 nucleotide-binding universal stress UspA family protein [Nocardiopsis mwathae]
MASSILVGVDGSEESLIALDWAAEEAALRGSGLRLLYSAWVPALEPIFLPGSGPWDDHAQRVLQAAEERVRLTDPGVHVESSIGYHEPAAATLIHASHEASLIVVGLRGRGGFPGMKIGSVAYEVAAHATVPVVVVGPEPLAVTTVPKIVVGVDDSDHGRAALRAAFVEARLRSARVEAIHSVRVPPAIMSVAMLGGYDLESMRGERERLTHDALKPYRNEFPDVEVETRVEWDDATHALSRASAGAHLVVVGARGRHGFPFLALGSVAHGILHHAASPVMIVHIATTEDD